MRWGDFYFEGFNVFFLGIFCVIVVVFKFESEYLNIIVGKDEYE